MLKTHHKKTLTGFTLIELITATGLFIIILLIVSSLFGRYMYTQRRDIAEQKLLEEVRLALELFNRETRTAYGSTYALADSSGQSLTYRNQNRVCVHYRLLNSRLERAESDLAGTDCPTSNFASAAYSPLTSSDIAITDLRFDVTSSVPNGTGLDRQGFVTLILSARVGDFAGTTLTTQSTVTSRQLAPYL